MRRRLLAGLGWILGRIFVICGCTRVGVDGFEEGIGGVKFRVADFGFRYDCQFNLVYSWRDGGLYDWYGDEGGGGKGFWSK